MAEDKSKTVIVKDRAKAFLTSKPEEETVAAIRPLPGKTTARTSQSLPKTGQKPMQKASEIAAAIRKGEISAPDSVKAGGTSLSDQAKAPAEKKAPMVSQGTTENINRKNKLVEDNKVKKIPACKMAEPMKRPADDTLIIAGRVTAAGKKIQTPVAVAKPEAKPAVAKVEVKEASAKEAVKEAAKPVAKKAEPKKEAAKPVAKKAEPKKEATKPVAKKAEPKKEVAKPAAKKAEPKKETAKPAAVRKNTYIQYQNNTFEEAELVVKAEKIWTGELKKKAADLKSLKLYVKPQERMVYCVYNEKETASFAI
ncbi:MAG: hypothetical protein J6K26_09240 [Lachnospiraceae bacterium]|nr:hypothetical protein [Lachnospiraceae bacterium]